MAERQPINQFSADAMKRIARAVVKSERARTPGNPLRRQGVAPDVNLIPVRLTFHADASGYNNPGWFGFEQVAFTPDVDGVAGEWEAVDGGLTQGEIGHCRSATGRSTVPVGSVVFLYPTYLIRSTYHVPLGGPTWEFAPPQDYVLAEITGNAAFGSTSARWKYAWREVVLASDGTYSTLEDGLEGTTDLYYALNKNELGMVAKSGATAWYVDGTQSNSTTASSAYPAGFAPRPIGGGGTSATHKQNVVVRMYQEICADGTPQYVFDAKMNHDGTCS